MHFFAPDGAQLYRDRRHKVGKGAPLCLNGALAFHIRALIATAEPAGNCPREPYSLPLHEGAQSRPVESGGRGRLPPPPPPKKKNLIHPKVPLF